MSNNSVAMDEQQRHSNEEQLWLVERSNTGTTNYDNKTTISYYATADAEDDNG
jgi:hypothetical protein